MNHDTVEKNKTISATGWVAQVIVGAAGTLLIVVLNPEWGITCAACNAGPLGYTPWGEAVDDARSATFIIGAICMAFPLIMCLGTTQMPPPLIICTLGAELTIIMFNINPLAALILPIATMILAFPPPDNKRHLV